jgi:hypothetical protein
MSVRVKNSEKKTEFNQNSAIKCSIQRICSYSKGKQNSRILLVMNFATADLASAKTYHIFEQSTCSI